MYLQKQFEERRPEVLHQLLAAHPFGLLVRQGPAGLVADALPWLIEPGPTPAGTLVGHVARANPLWRELADGDQVLVVFQGPQAYVSPGWYPSKAEHGKVVPTWNYAMVQARGRVQIHDDPAAVRAIVERLSARHEGGRPRPWTLDDAPPDFMDSLLQMIVGVRIPLDSLTGKFKLSQNRAASDRAGVRDGLVADGGDERRAMVDWMERLES
ncbi:FMN-binding negative transcriptional regulator [Aquincola sp. S2]|uniref:FMN-binding negative transcriptional regulator n=1 Tax=Pseudaquabacterium terrae TaxID=2732868 RepID=A0ABX2EH03_9BURK|nr:FMN-binding negative transcriptional regulator [Aquabacterium terrae]NRF67867.1 FMN-binding negative transcriptional regulator [Aquabacterium terrae]